MAPDTQKRPISARHDKAAATRGRIRVAAQELFLANGYAATSMERIAKSAGVAVQTTYYIFGTKLNLLKELIDVAIAGDDDPIPTLERTWVSGAVAAEPVQQVEIQVEAAREISERVAVMLQILRGAATADPEAAKLWKDNREQFRTVQRHLIRALADKTPLPSGVDIETATDIATTILGIDTYVALVAERGWTSQEWRDWATDLLKHQLLPKAQGEGRI